MEEIKTFAIFVWIVCMIFVVYFTVHSLKMSKEMDKMFEDLDNDFYKKMKALILHITDKEALELIHEIVTIPDGFYLGINVNDILEVTLFETDKNTPNNMGKSIATFNLNSYRPSELISFGIELERYIAEIRKDELL